MNFSKVGILIALFGISLLAACTQKTHIFSGESDNWSVRYEVNKTDRCTETNGYIQYIGTESTPERLDFSIHDSEGSVPLELDGRFTLPQCSRASEDVEITAIIKWDNESEEIPLKVE